MVDFSFEKRKRSGRYGGPGFNSAGHVPQTDLDDHYVPDMQSDEHVFDFKPAKKRLHWMQWVVYITVVITCIMAMITMLELWAFVHNVRQALIDFSDSLTTGGF